MVESLKQFFVELKKENKFLYASSLITFVYSTISFVVAICFFGNRQHVPFSYFLIFMMIFYIPFIATIIIAKKNFIMELKKYHKFLLAFNIITFLFSTTVFIIMICSMIKLEPFASPCVIFFAPMFYISFIATLLISKFAIKTYKKYPIITNIMTFILNSFVVVCLYLLTLTFIFEVHAVMLSNISYTNIKSLKSNININNYSKAISSMYDKEHVSHFPNTIPKTATDIKFFKSSNLKGDWIILKFNADDKFIVKELKKYNYKLVDKSNKYYTNLLDQKDLTDYDIYFLGDTRYNSKGIGLSKDKKQIIYFYNCLKKY